MCGHARDGADGLDLHDCPPPSFSVAILAQAVVFKMALPAQVFQILLYQSDLHQHGRADHVGQRLVVVSRACRVVVGGFLDLTELIHDYQNWLDYEVQQGWERAESEALGALIDDWFNYEPGAASPFWEDE